MKYPFDIGKVLTYSKIVQPAEKAAFETGTVHEVYATFHIAKDAEWSTRLFVLEMKEEDEEGIGTFIHVDHIAPALIGSKVDYDAKLEEINNHEIICSFEARVGERLIARGKTGQKILKKEKLNRLINAVQQL